jgi:DNA-3-methyladenine glycosylase II
MHYVPHLSRDKKMKSLIAAHGPVKLSRHKNVCHLLCASIMSQQLAVPVARTIKRRFLDLFGGQVPGPGEILAVQHERLRAIGLSNAKASYIHNVARFALERGLDARTLGKMNDEEAIAYLTEIKGVGRWTVEMLLMFTLGREDVFSLGDGGLRAAIRKLYGLRAGNKKALDKKMTAIAEQWKPYRTFACMHLWKFKDGDGPAARKMKTGKRMPRAASRKGKTGRR